MIPKKVFGWIYWRLLKNWGEFVDTFVKIQILRGVYVDICKVFSKCDTEMCGILGSTNGVSISNWEFIHVPNNSLFNINLKEEILEYIVNNKWHKNGVKFIGLVHNHNNVFAQAYLSPKDVNAAYEILRLNSQLEFIYMLIFYGKEDGTLYGYRLSRPSLNESCKVNFAEVEWEII